MSRKRLMPAEGRACRPVSQRRERLVQGTAEHSHGVLYNLRQHGDFLVNALQDAQPMRTIKSISDNDRRLRSALNL